MIFHPRFKTLSRYADGELERRGKARVARHLTACTDCRKTVSFLRRLSDAKRQLAEPDVPAGSWDEIVARRARGDRVILPSEDPDPLSVRVPRGRHLAIAAAVLLAVFSGLVLFRSVPEAEALKSELRFRPANPQMGARVEVEYRPGSALAGEETLELRARYRTSMSEIYNLGPMQSTVGALTRGADGIFRGSFELADSVVYALFAVEDLDATYVDHNQRRLWELAVHGLDGRPLYEALEQKTNDLIGRNWELAFETAQQMTALYPDRPGAWAIQRSFERQVLGSVAAESLMAEHAARFQEFHRELRDRPNVPIDLVLGMTSYALDAGDAEAWRYWDERFRREFPNHPWTIGALENELSEKYFGDADGVARYLTELEPLWARISGGTSLSHSVFMYNALVQAALASEPDGFLRWVARYRSYGRARPGMLLYIAEQMDRWPGLQEQKLRLLREVLGELEAVPDDVRALENSVEAQRLENRSDTQRLLAALGAALIAAGDTAAALDTLALATSRNWDALVFRSLAETQLAIGDTVGALQNLARVAADPLSDAAITDSARRIGGRHFEPEQWEKWVVSGRLEMAERILAGSIRRRPTTEPSLVDERGKVHTLGQLRGANATVVLFWSRRCGPAVRAIPEINTIHSWLEERGVPLVTVVHEPSSENFRQYVAGSDIGFAIHHDHRGEAKTAFNNFATPEYYVLDDAGRVVFSGSGSSALRMIPRQVAVLGVQTLVLGDTQGGLAQ